MESENNRSLSYAMPPTVEVNCAAVDYFENGSGMVGAEIGIVLCCGECGTGLKEYREEVDLDFNHNCQVSKPDSKELTFDSFRVENTKGKGTVCWKTTNAKDEVVEVPYYGADVTITLRCNVCGETIDCMENIAAQISAYAKLA